MYAVILNQMEFNWHSIAQGERTSDEINELRFKFLDLEQKARVKHVRGSIPTDNEKWSTAEEYARTYLTTYYRESSK